MLTDKLLSHTNADDAKKFEENFSLNCDDRVLPDKFTGTQCIVSGCSERDDIVVTAECYIFPEPYTRLTDWVKSVR